MKSRKTLLLLAVVVVLMPWTIAAQQQTARDAFWSSSDLITVTPNPATHKHGPTHPPRARQTSDSNSTESSNGSAVNKQFTARKAVQLVSENGYGATPHLTKTAEDRLGLRCSV
ncbi:MAG: hypothetical protein WA426_07060, partial [Silvibacterium sp.]